MWRQIEVTVSARTSSTRERANTHRVLVVDVGGTSVKLATHRRQERATLLSGPTMTPRHLVRDVLGAVRGWDFDAVSMGYPGPVRDGRVVKEPWNLGPGWRGFDFERALGCPVRMLNDAAMQALGAWRGGRMLFLGLGTGLGTALVDEGVVVPMELAHLRCRDGRTFEEDLGSKGLARLGLSAWRRAVEETVATLTAVFLPDEVVLGGGNVHRLASLPRGVRRGTNEDAFRGGRLLWQEGPAPRPVPRREEAACSGRDGSR